MHRPIDAPKVLCNKLMDTPGIQHITHRSCSKVARALAASGRMCPREVDHACRFKKVDHAWNGCPSCVEELVASDLAEPIS